MNEVLQFLQDAKSFTITTVDGDKPRSRPFGFVMVYQGKLCFCTNNQKDVYKQMKANPNIEICALVERKWMRVSGNAVFCTDTASKTAALDAAPGLKNMYSVDDGKFEIFYIDNMKVENY